MHAGDLSLKYDISTIDLIIAATFMVGNMAMKRSEGVSSRDFNPIA
jgi:hypothetical protein